MNAPVRSPTRSPRRTICFSGSRRPGSRPQPRPTTPLAAQVAAAIDSDADVIVAAGGDGTITAVASALVGTDTALAILPLGTVNLLARDLGIPLDVNAAIAALAAMQPRKIDVGEVNGAVFLHKIVFGFVPGLAAARERLRGRGFLARWRTCAMWSGASSGHDGPQSRSKSETGAGGRCVCLPSQFRITITMKASDGSSVVAASMAAASAFTR